MKPFYTVAEVADALQLHPKTVLNKIRAGDIQATKVGRQYRVSEDQMRLLSGGSSQPVQQTRGVLVSTVVDISAISPAESARITNTMLAAISQHGQDLRIDAIDYPELGRLKLVINSRDLGDTERLLAMLGQLLERP